VQPHHLMSISTRHDRTTAQWSMSYIAYTPETYTVNYGRAMNSLNMSVTATRRGENFTIPSKPFMFSAELTGLDPGVTYYYQVEARNSEGPTLSAVQQFKSAELRMYLTYHRVGIIESADSICRDSTESQKYWTTESPDGRNLLLLLSPQICVHNVQLLCPEYARMSKALWTAFKFGISISTSGRGRLGKNQPSYNNN